MAEENDVQVSSPVADSGKRCKTCGYNLTGLTEYRCPECGSFFGPYALYFKRRRGVIWFGVRLLVLIFCCLIACLITVITLADCFDGRSARPFGMMSGPSSSLVVLMVQLPVSVVGILIGASFGSEFASLRKWGIVTLVALGGISGLSMTLFF